MAARSDVALPTRTADKAIATEAFQRLVATASEPPFLDQLEATWGACWGAHDEVGVLRIVLLREPSAGLMRVDEAAWNESVHALVDPDGKWYWLDRHAPDIALLRRQHDGLANLLREQGVDVVIEPSVSDGHTKDMFVRDPMVTVPGGAVIGRMAAVMRRGEEVAATRSVASLGFPILGTIIGTGTLEGGSVVKLERDVAALGIGVRCNDEGADQLGEILGRVGMELVRVPLPGHSIHLDLHLAMVGVRRALVRSTLPAWFVADLRKRGFELIEAPAGEPWGLNLLCLRPGCVVMAEGSPRTAELLRDRGIEVLTLPYDEVQKNGGGVHCSTMELVRDSAA